ncbi:hypothetical protein [Desulforamulus ruminis]|uniref:hypothetical protein n=1 Tax=Desulforamulus ruminis TaxID=1564 RepID=UPI00235577E8|nr:hypothetical protein [Desulforamulus ruminis]
MIILIVLAFGVIVFLEVPGLVKKKAWRELAVFSFFLILGFTLALLQVMGVALPNPNHAIEALFRPFTEWME